MEVVTSRSGKDFDQDVDPGGMVSGGRVDVASGGFTGEGSGREMFHFWPVMVDS